MKTSVYTFFEKTILENIDLEDYGFNNDCYLYDKVKTLYNVFKNECVHANNKHISEEKIFAGWLQGLPNILTVPFYEFEILENALLAGINVIDEDLFLSAYWDNLSYSFFTLKENL